MRQFCYFGLALSLCPDSLLDFLSWTGLLSCHFKVPTLLHLQDLVHVEGEQMHGVYFAEVFLGSVERWYIQMIFFSV